MIAYKDFVPKLVREPGLIKGVEFESFEEAVEAAREWIAREGIEPINVETVVLPNIHAAGEEGSEDTSLRTDGKSGSHWYQLVRIWYEED